MKITQAKALAGYRLHLRFDNGAEGEVDLSSYAGQGVFSAWLEPEFFARASITPEGAVAWPGNLDLCPDALYIQMTGKTAEDIFPKISSSLAHA